ncbi:MBL fold metallo-hydrolase [bacterium]|nr:MBL fold metallo-hydrolase [bacterium]
MIIKKFIKNGPLQNNNYVIIDEESREAVLIDCSEPTDDIMDYIKEQGADLKYILLTHVHPDHIQGVNYYRKKYGVSVFLHKDDFPLLSQLGQYFAGAESVSVDKLFDDDAEFSIGNEKIKVIHTPGHTEGSVCYLIDNMLFSGDTLFYETHGRTDLPFSDDAKMRSSLKKLFTLDDNIVVYPGHRKDTTIGAEKVRY